MSRTVSGVEQGGHIIFIFFLFFFSSLMCKTHPPYFLVQGVALSWGADKL